MSRWSRDDDRETTKGSTQTREAEARLRERVEDLPGQSLTLPRGEERERVEFRDREYTLDGAETRALATIGAFRVVMSDDLESGRHAEDASHGDWRHLSDQGLLTRETLTDRDGARHVMALTRTGKALLDAHRPSPSTGRQQEYYAGVVKPRELRHDAQLYRVYKEETARIEREGGHVTRVVLDYELKRDYQQFLNRPDRRHDADVDADRFAFAAAHDLHVIQGHLELPDLRIEYEAESGRLEHRDVELETEHYSRGQLAGKAKAGFVRYRAAGASGRGGNSRRGGTPLDPRYLERL